MQKSVQYMQYHAKLFHYSICHVPYDQIPHNLKYLSNELSVHIICQETQTQ